MSAEDFVSWGAGSGGLQPAVTAPVLAVPVPAVPVGAAPVVIGAPAPAATSAPRAKRQVRSILHARANAVVWDGLVLSVPLVLVDVLMGQLFPGRGFFSTAPGSASLGLPGTLLMIALWLSYYAMSEARTGQTFGKRRMGLRVVSVDGGPAGVRAIAARTLLRLVDDLGLYLVGLMVMILTGQRRRRLGDLAGRTVVVRVDATAAARPEPGLLAWIYPVVWVGTVLVAAFGFGLGAQAQANTQAIGLVRSYETARESGNAGLACSLLATDQQREMVARVTNNYRAARSASCPAYVLQSSPHSSTVDPRLPELLAGPVVTRPTVSGGVDVISMANPEVHLYAISESGRTVLDARGLEKLSFVHACSSAGRPTVSCLCVYEYLRAQRIDLYAGPTANPPARVVERALAADWSRCLANPAGRPF